MFYSSSSCVAKIKAQLSLRYKMNDLGIFSWYLGVDIVHINKERKLYASN